MTEHEPFDLDDPYLVRLRSLALALPGAAEKLVVGHPAFYTRKVFAYFAMSRKVDGGWEIEDQAGAVREFDLLVVGNGHHDDNLHRDSTSDSPSSGSARRQSSIGSGSSRATRRVRARSRPPRVVSSTSMSTPKPAGRSRCLNACARWWRTCGRIEGGDLKRFSR